MSAQEDWLVSQLTDTLNAAWVGHLQGAELLRTEGSRTRLNRALFSLYLEENFF